jgi:hypothetical protein
MDNTSKTQMDNTSKTQMDIAIRFHLRKIFPLELNEIISFRIGMGNAIFLNIEITKNNERVLFHKKDFLYEGKTYIIIYNIKYIK